MIAVKYLVISAELSNIYFFKWFGLLCRDQQYSMFSSKFFFPGIYDMDPLF